MKNTSVNEGIGINIGRAENVEKSIITLSSIIVYRKIHRIITILHKDAI